MKRIEDIDTRDRLKRDSQVEICENCGDICERGDIAVTNGRGLCGDCRKGVAA